MGLLKESGAEPSQARTRHILPSQNAHLRSMVEQVAVRQEQILAQHQQILAQQEHILVQHQQILAQQQHIQAQQQQIIAGQQQ